MTQVGDQFKLTPKEVMAIGMGLARVIEDLEETRNDQSIPWTPETRLMMKDMYDSAKSAAGKIEAITGFECRLDAYEDGDEKDYLTKPS